MIPLAALTVAGCLAVNPASDRVTAGDLAAVIPGLTTSAPEESVAFAPAPGVLRVFHVPELRRLAIRQHWNVEPSADVCVERPVFPADSEKLLEAMHRTLPQAAITILDYARQPLPAGDIEFPAAGLRSSAAGALWIGAVHYAGTRRLTVWTRVKVAVTASRVLAAVDLRPGEAVNAAQLRVETSEVFPVAAPILQSVDDAVGKWPRTTIRSGTALRADMLHLPPDIARGDTIAVEVHNGAAHLELEALAEGPGSIGEMIPVRNVSTRKRFLARVEGKGRVSVTVAGPAKVNP